MKSQDIIGKALDHWVARALGMELVTVNYVGTENESDWQISNAEWMDEVSMNEAGYYYVDISQNFFISINEFKPSTDWAVGGPIMEEHTDVIRKGVLIKDGKFIIATGIDKMGSHHFKWLANANEGNGGGDSMLIAAMRCIVFNKFGWEIPDEKEH